MKTKKRNEKTRVNLIEEMQKNPPFTEEEAEKILKRITAFEDRLRKSFGEDRINLYTSSLQCITTEQGSVSSNRGNMAAAKLSIAEALRGLIDSGTTQLKMTHEQLLLFAVTDIAHEVRSLWAEDGMKKKPTKSADSSILF